MGPRADWASTVRCARVDIHRKTKNVMSPPSLHARSIVSLLRKTSTNPDRGDNEPRPPRIRSGRGVLPVAARGRVAQRMKKIRLATDLSPLLSCTKYTVGTGFTGAHWTEPVPAGCRPSTIVATRRPATL